MAAPIRALVLFSDGSGAFRSHCHRAIVLGIQMLDRRVRFTHVALSDGSIVLETGPAGTRLWPLLDYAQNFPGLGLAIEVPCPRPPDLASLAGWPPIGLWSAGWGDCVAATRAAARTGGVDLPWALTPHRLAHRLLTRNYPHAWLH
jgi:hypothetical protein